jgi:hypothetical protein
MLEIETTENFEMLQTADLSVFKFLKNNREILPFHVQKLMALISESNDLHLHPVIVDEDMNVIDGQHRIMAAKALNLPVYYVVDYNYHPHKMISINTSQKEWTNEDYLKYYVTQGREDYIKFEELLKETGFTITNVLRWSTTSCRMFKTGSFIFKFGFNVINALDTVRQILEKVHKLNPEMSKKLKWNKFFHSASKSFFSSPNVDHERFLRKMDIALHYLAVYYSADDFCDMFLAMYNYHEKVKLGKEVRGKITTFA